MQLQDEPLEGPAVAGVAVEVLALCADAGGVDLVLPSGTTNTPIPVVDEHPHVAATTTVTRLGLVPRFVHSTSWRYADRTVLLTYVAVVDEPAPHLPVTRRRVGSGPLALGGPLAPPDAIDVDHVVAHTLRHLAWLVDRDPAAAAQLDGWRPHLQGHTPEPFRALDGGGEPESTA
jgi:hypothetical protein